MKITVIIFANSKDDILENCLHAISMQKRAADEVIVADTETDREVLVKSVLGNQCIYHFHAKEKRYHVETARCFNAAAAIASGTLLVFMNDCVLLPPDHLRKMEILFHSDSIGAAVFQQQYLSRPVSKEGSALSRICYKDMLNLAKLDYPALRDKHLIYRKYPWGQTNLLCYAVRKEDFDDVSGYDEQLAVYAGSDANLIYKLSQQNIKIVYPPEMDVYIQKKEQYPAVRWRASGSEYTAYCVPETNAMDWFSIKTLIKQIIDYNRYHAGKCMLSGLGSHSLATRFNEKDADTALILLIDCIPDETVKAQMTSLAKRDVPIYLVSLLPKDTAVTETLMEQFVGYQNVVFCKWLKKEEWETICQILKLMEVVKRTSHHADFMDYIQVQRAELLNRKLRLENDICNTLDYEPAAQKYIVRKMSAGLSDECSTAISIPDEKLTIKIFNFPSFSYQHKPGFSLPPRTISFRLTYACNLHCKMCGQWGKNGIYLDKDSTFIKQHLPIEILKKTVDETAIFSPGMYYIWGGEPLLHPDYLELVRYIKQKGIYCTTTTNGMFLKKYAKELCEIGTEFIRISLDGTEQIHNSIRGNPNCYQTVMEAIHEITRIKKELHTVYPIIECDSVIIKDNYQQIESYIEEISAIDGINSINFSHPIYSNQDVGKRQAAEYQKEFGLSATAWCGFATDEEKLDPDELIAIVNRIQHKQYRIPVNFDPPMRSLSDIRLHYTDIEKLYSKRFCTVPWIWVEIHPDGKVSFCEDFCDYYIGNLYNDDFFSIWNGEAAQKYRNVLLKRNQFPICSYCGLLCHDADF